MNKNKQAWIWIGIVVVVLVILALLIAIPRMQGNQGVSATHAPQGQLVSGFPTGLVLDSAAHVSDSYSIPYSASTTQYTAEWTSQSSTMALAISYNNYFMLNGWKVVVSGPKSGIWGISATTSTAHVLVSIAPGSSSSTALSVTYVTQ